jgi:hypothetical protein
MAIFGIGVVGLLQANLLASAQNGLASQESDAVTIGRDLVDTFERLPYSHSAISAGTHALTTQSDYGSELPLLGVATAVVNSDARINAAKQKYTVGWNVTEVSNGAGEVEYKRVNIGVEFQIAGKPKTISFFTVKFNPQVMVGSSTGFPEI